MADQGGVAAFTSPDWIGWGYRLNFVRLLFLDSEVRGRYVDWQSLGGLSVRSAHDHPLRRDLDRYARCYTDEQDLTAQHVARKQSTRCEPVRPASR